MNMSTEVKTWITILIVAFIVLSGFIAFGEGYQAAVNDIEDIYCQDIGYSYAILEWSTDVIVFSLDDYSVTCEKTETVKK